MIIAGILLTAVGFAGLVLGLAPEAFANALTAHLDHAPIELPGTAQQATIGSAGAIYLSGIILIGAGLIRRAMLAELRTRVDQRADFEGLQNAVLLAIERLETRYGEADQQKQLVSNRMRDLAAEFERSVPKGFGVGDGHAPDAFAIEGVDFGASDKGGRR